MTFNIKLIRKPYHIYGEYEKINYKEARAILSDCLLAGNMAHIKVNDNSPYLNDRNIKNDNDFRLFIEEFGGLEEYEND